ncbi:uncharacterized protein LOC130663926 [Microplitis mediator]|uniref:uncharacterized protein LOC130663926 n=1 Tax=Microplitis mediator TaxID=375433 RepID=UPI002556BE97|nr:uncharacterized protein LOC130663926 [Microplitis mediator]XP_057319482.1 uncharacterized protein LOC130663926 [Microplitis mediator]XP_057319483.1 uncharacterized protein LOC130663926 [Microplitis mediator]XP_057319484.1 uncharacterized protein LOC130663926 [Microplitis mediator]XP_057319485.1 uncharacterized protein LOC130663926 [Microplitis mediator]
MSSRKRVYEHSGWISDILSSDTAVISFDNKDITDNVLLKKSNFYYKGKVIDSNECFDNYLSIGVTVKFSGYTWCSEEYSDCTWYATICWTLDSSPWSSVAIKSGLMFVSGRIASLNNLRGVIELTDNSGKSHRILFVANKLYCKGEKFSGKTLTEEVKIGDCISFDAIPCIAEENDEQCQWFATCAYIGIRPKLINSSFDNINGECDFSTPVWNDNIEVDSQNDFNISCLKLIKENINNPNTLFVCGRGIVVDIINDEFGVMLGEFSINCFQTIIFHRRSTFIDKLCLNMVDLAEIFTNGDRLNFVAVGAPSGFLTDWIAVQVSAVLTDLKKDAGVNNSESELSES